MVDIGPVFGAISVTSEECIEFINVVIVRVPELVTYKIRFWCTFPWFISAFQCTWPLFIHSNGTPLTHACLVKEALSRAGMDTTGYSGHSFHIGAATTAAQADLPASLSQSLGGTGKTRNEEQKKLETGNGKWVMGMGVTASVYTSCTHVECSCELWEKSNQRQKHFVDWP